MRGRSVTVKTLARTSHLVRESLITIFYVRVFLRLKKMKSQIKEIVRNVENLDKVIAQIKKSVKNFKTCADELISDVETLEFFFARDNLCSICYVRTPSFALGCGHILCGNCKDRAVNRDPPRCFSCRKPVESVIKLFF